MGQCRTSSKATGSVTRHSYRQSHFVAFWVIARKLHAAPAIGRSEMEQEHELQGWATYPLLLHDSSPYTDDLYYARERLQSQASLLFVEDPQKVSLEMISHGNDEKGGITIVLESKLMWRRQFNCSENSDQDS